MGEAVFGWCASGGRGAVGVLLAWGELVGAGRGEAGNDHGVTYVVVQAAEAEVRQGPEAGCAQVSRDVIVAGGGDVVVRTGRAADIQIRQPLSKGRARKCRP
ncbi:hypothetical protein [Streptomyces sp. NPDC088141]|uniref:hypothetical protein n=1 Tax=Streptomyces sp. NPDC088141 TaxID=3155179 RepID=UPI00341209E0